MEELIDNYLNEIYDLDIFKELQSLKISIDKLYRKEIVSFKTNESNYLEAEKYGKYYPNLDELRRSFSNAKANLYSKPEVKRYLELERKIEEKINSDLNLLKESISNKFKTKNTISCAKKLV